MQEKQQRLFDAAQEIFQELGFKKTNIVKITQRAGVAVGTFYRFYNSKEEIFLEVYQTENERIKQAVLADNDLTEDPHVLLPKIMKELMQKATNSLILQARYVNPKLKQLVADDPATQEDYLYSTLLQFIEQWQKRDLIQNDMTIDRVRQLFEAVMVIDNHQDELPVGDFEQLMNDLIEGILQRILKEP